MVGSAKGKWKDPKSKDPSRVYEDDTRDIHVGMRNWKRKLQTDPDISVQQEKEQASVERQIKKLCRIFKPHLVSYMKDHLVLLESKDDKNIALFWLLKNGHGSELSMSTYGFGDTIAEARDYVKDANTPTEVLFNE